MTDIDNHMNGHGDEDLVWLEPCVKCGEDYEVDENGNGYCKPCAPWSSGIGTLAVDLALMSRGGLLKNQAE